MVNIVSDCPKHGGGVKWGVTEGDVGEWMCGRWGMGVERI